MQSRQRRGSAAAKARPFPAQFGMRTAQAASDQQTTHAEVREGGDVLTDKTSAGGSHQPSAAATVPLQSAGAGQSEGAGGAGGAGTVALTWRHPDGMIQLSLINAVLRALTLGIYGFWAKTEVRKRIWSGVRINGEPLTYIGTGKELMIGFLLVFGVILLPVFIVNVTLALTFGPNSTTANAFSGALTILFLFLFGVAVHRAQRYRLSRTTWRGIRGYLDGSAASYGIKYFLTFALIPLTLGWIIPWRTTYLQKAITNEMRFGSKPLAFEASSLPLYPRFAVLWVGIVAAVSGVLIWIGVVRQAANLQRLPEAGTIDPQTAMIVLFAGILPAVLFGGLIYGVLTAWYRAKMINHFARATTYESARFSSTVTARGLIYVTITNFLIFVFSLGILQPVATARLSRYLIEHLRLDGTVDFAAVAQAQADATSRGEGLAQAFDIDGI